MSYKITSDVENNTATLDLFVDGNFVTGYAFADSQVTLSERPTQVIIQLDELKQNVNGIKEWIDTINRTLQVEFQNRPEFQEKITKTENKIKLYFEFEGIVVSDAVYKESDNTIAFEPRPEVILPYRCFIAWYNKLQEMINDIDEF